MQVTIEHQGQHQGGVAFEARARGHAIRLDQPLDNNGGDTGMTPPEVMLAALGACAGHYAAEYLRVRGLPSAGLRVRVEAGKKSGPARLDDFRIEIDLAHDYEPRHREGILRAVKHCLLHNTLLNPPVIEVCLNNSRALDAAA